MGEFGTDLQLNVALPPYRQGFDAGFDRFVELLHLLKRSPLFQGIDWFSQHAEDEPKLFFFKDTEASRLAFAKHNKDRETRYSIWGWDNPERYNYTIDYTWNASIVDHLILEIFYLNPQFLQQPQTFIDLIALILEWQRPQHLRFGPLIYMRDHHPLDRAREGIGWMGWVPFALNPSDVPEAELVREMNGGSLIVTQSEFWQAWPQHPQYSKDAIERAQEVELRLNLLGVLPTVDELAKGDWGQ